MKKFFFLGLLVAATLVSCKEKTVVETTPAEPTVIEVEQAPATNDTITLDTMSK